MPAAGVFAWPSPMPLHGIGQLFDQHWSMPLPIWTPVGCWASHAAMQAARGSLASVPPPLVPLDDDVIPELEEAAPLDELAAPELLVVVVPEAPELDELEASPVLDEQASAVVVTPRPRTKIRFAPMRLGA